VNVVSKYMHGITKFSCILFGLICFGSWEEAKAVPVKRLSIGYDGTESPGHSFYPHVVDNGRTFCFDSDSSNIVPGDTNGFRDIFLWNRITNQKSLLGFTNSGLPTNGDNIWCVFSKTGRFVAIASAATNIVPEDRDPAEDGYILDRKTGKVELLTPSITGGSGNGWTFPLYISPGGRFVLMYSLANNLVPNDTNGTRDVFLRDRLLKTTTLISKSSEGIQGNNESIAEFFYSMSPDNRYILFYSKATNLDSVARPADGTYRIYVHDRIAGTTRMVRKNEAGEDIGSPITWAILSRDGQRIYLSTAASMNPADTNGKVDVYSVPINGTRMRLESVNKSGQVGTGGDTHIRAVSKNGRYILMRSNANGLSAKVNSSMSEQLIVKDQQTGRYYYASGAYDGSPSNGYIYDAIFDPSGKYISYETLSSNLTADPDVGNDYDIFYKEMTYPADE
jgi:hypothetical protein